MTNPVSFLKSSFERLRAVYRDAQTREIHSGITDPTTRYSIEIARMLAPGENFERVFQDGPPPSLDDFEHKRSNVPPGARLKAWAKLREAERRLEIALWAMWRTEPDTGKHKVFAEDQVSAFFYAVEATIQVLKEEMGTVHGPKWFEPWLSKHPNSTVHLRGIRTIRTIAVHVQELLVDSGISISTVRGHGGTITRCWHLPAVDPSHLVALKSPKLSTTEVSTWNALRAQRSCGSISEDALKDLREIVFDAEHLVV